MSWRTHFITLASVLCASVAFAVPTKPLLPSEEAKSSLPSADATLTDMWVSHPYEATSPKAHPGATLTEVEAQLINDFTHGTGHFKRLAGVPAKNKGFVLRRYEEGDKGVTDAVIELAKTHPRLALGIFDSNPAFKGDFKKGEKFNSDFENATPREYSKGHPVPMAEMIERLQKEGGLKLNDLTHGLVMQPLYDGDMVPIMHNKDMFFIEYDDKGGIKSVELFTGTNNMTDPPRYNRMFRVVDPVIIQRVLDNATQMAAIFSKGGQIKDMPAKPPLKVTYKDGSTIEVAFTDGKYNPNDRIVETLKQAAAHPDQLKLKHITLSEFVLTDGDVVEALRAALKAQPGLKVTTVLDDQFLDLFEYGKGAALAGFSTTPPHGKSTFGFSRDLRARIQGYAYQRKVDGVEMMDNPDGLPLDRHLWHDKTTVIELEQGGEDLVEVYTGSFNLSTNGANAELQLKIRTKASSGFGTMITESVSKVAANEPDYAVKLETGVFRHWLAQFTGQSVFDVSVPDTDKVSKALQAGKFSDATAEMRDLAKQKSNLGGKKATEAEVEARIARLDKFLAWYGKSSTFGKSIDPQHLTAAAVGIAHPDAFPGTVLQQMRSALYDPKLSADKLDEEAKQAMKELELKIPTGKDAAVADADPASPAAVAAEKCGDILINPDTAPPRPDGYVRLQGGL